MESGIYTDKDYNFLDEDIIQDLELFFANTNLSREQRNKIVDLLTRTRDQITIECGY